MEANTEIKKYKDTIKRLYQLLKSVCQERDEAKEQLQLLSTRFQPSLIRSLTNTRHEIQQIQLWKPVVPSKMTSSVISRSSTKESDLITPKMTFTCLSNDLSLAGHEGQSSNFTVMKKPDHEERAEKMKENIRSSRDIMVDTASSVIDNLVLGKQLPEKGRLLRSVTEAGPLLQTLLIAPAPRWKNPPPCTSSSSGDSAIPTSLSLAFAAGNSIGAPQMSFGCVQNDQMQYSNRTQNQIIGKKRKVLLG